MIDLDFSKALKCPVCNKHIISYNDVYANNTCSAKCSKIIYQKEYYKKVTKNKRKGILV